MSLNAEKNALVIKPCSKRIPRYRQREGSSLEQGVRIRFHLLLGNEKTRTLYVQKFPKLHSEKSFAIFALIAMLTSALGAVACIAIRVIPIFMAFVCKLHTSVHSSHSYLAKSQSTHRSVAPVGSRANKDVAHASLAR